MNRISQVVLTIGLLVGATWACTVPGAPTAAPTPDNQATISAAVAATAQVAIQATIAAGVQGTATALATAATSVATPTTQTTATPATLPQATPSVAAPPPTAAINPTPIPPDYNALTEEELAALIDQAVAEAVVATQQASTTTTSATADDTVSQQEAQTVEVYVNGAEAAIAYADELITAYTGIYGELAVETVSLLQEVEDDLSVMTDSMEVIGNTLEQNSETLEKGLQLAGETIGQAEEAAQSAQDRAAQAKDRATKWNTQLGREINRRADAIQGIKPDRIAPDRQGAVLMAFDFIDATHLALGDNKLTRDEMLGIGQLGANAAASLGQHGGPALQQMPGRINGITTRVARGELPQARKGLGELDRDLGARPERPQPGGVRPGKK